MTTSLSASRVIAGDPASALLLISGPAAAEFLPDAMLTETRPGQVAGVLRLAVRSRARHRGHDGGPAAHAHRVHLRFPAPHRGNAGLRRRPHGDLCRARAGPTSSSPSPRRKTSRRSWLTPSLDRSSLLRRPRARRPGAEPGGLARLRQRAESPAIVGLLPASPRPRASPSTSMWCGAAAASHSRSSRAARTKSAAAPGELPRAWCVSPTAS